MTIIITWTNECNCIHVAFTQPPDTTRYLTVMLKEVVSKT